MASIKKDLVANFFSKVLSTLLSLMLLPYYVKLIGIEAYGLVGFYVTLQALFSILDMGLMTAMNREMACFSVSGSDPQEPRNLTRTLEYFYWTMALIIGGSIYFLSPVLSTHWIQSNSLPQDVVCQSVRYIGLALALLWPSSLYAGGLLGMQKQVLLNSIGVSTAIIRAFGLVLILSFISPTLQAFLIWQAVINLLQTILTAFYHWKHLLPSPVCPRFDWQALSRIKKFALGIACSTVLATVLAQVDKVLLIRFVSLDQFGYYTLATTAATALFYAIGPVFTVFFPRLTQLLHSSEIENLKRMYHVGCQLMAVAIIPIALLVICFSNELICLWTRSPETAGKTGLLVSVLIAGTLINGLLTIPYALQLAYGWTRLSLWLNLGGVVLMIPGTYWLVVHYGTLGAASGWLFLNLIHFFIVMHVMYKKILPDEKRNWFLRDICFPLSGALAIIVPAKWFFATYEMNRLMMISYLGVVFMLALLCAIVLTPFARAYIIENVLNRVLNSLKSKG